MMLTGFAIGAILLGGVLSLLLGKYSRRAALFSSIGISLGALLGLFQAFTALFASAPLNFSVGWSVPYGSLDVGIDPLSAFFLIPIFILTALSAVYGSRYLSEHAGKKSTVASWFFLSLLVASMIAVIIARNAILFLFAWEIMALSSFFLVCFDSEKESVRSAGWTYLVATHIGTAFLFLFFAIAGVKAGSFNFSEWGMLSSLPGPALLGMFLLAVAGFGSKAGIIPLHVWLPEAHPAAPSHVSAIMSGVMIKTGIYGLLRTMTFLGFDHIWWGYLLVFVGLTSGVLGVLYALAQRDLKSLLAYSSVENIGIIFLGIGMGTIGVATGSDVVAVLGFAGALLHVLNHSLFKGLLFLGAGSVLYSTRTAAIDRLGGLLKRTPITGGAFLVGSVAISGLPPLNGFVSELMIYLSAILYFSHLLASNIAGVWNFIPAIATIAGLAFIGGLASSCFARAFGIAFLGEPRDEMASKASEVPMSMRLPMLLLSGACIFIGLCGPLMISFIAPALLSLAGLDAESASGALSIARWPMIIASASAAALIILTCAVMYLRRWLLRGREVTISPTWDCGYESPSPKMQYTASSFAAPLVGLFKSLVRIRISAPASKDFFPEGGSYEEHPADIFREGMFAPIFRFIQKISFAFRWLQNGNVHLYILYIALTLLALLVWKLGGL